MLRRALPVIACLAMGFAFIAPLHAQEEGEEDTSDLSFEQKLIHQFMTAMGAKSGREVGINYRERSPLVLPPNMALPEPQTNNAAALAPNWPKDPDEQARREAAAAAKAPRDDRPANRQLMPSELAKGRIAAGRNSPQPGETPVANRQLSPSELGYRGGLFGNILTPMKEETAKFEGEPTRKTLTAPPVGYQTPSPNYSYGIGVTAKQEVDPSRPLAPGKF